MDNEDMDDNVRAFARPTTKVPAKRMVRVIDVTSPFFTWEGWICNVMAQGDEEEQYVQIMCAHSGFQFPALTFSTKQIAEIK